MDELQPPRKSIELEDPGAHELSEKYSSDDHFSDAQEGQQSLERSRANSPIPITRVERVDDEPAYGEIPGTPAYQMRMTDAVPDEVEVVPEGQRSRSVSRVSTMSRNNIPLTPGGSPIPKTVVEKIDPDTPTYGDVPGTAAHQLRQADAEPDVILKAPTLPNRSVAAALSTPEQPPNDSLRDEDGAEADISDDADDDDNGEDEEDQENGNDFGDDFDDFEEGEEGGDEEDFGDFDDGFEAAQRDAGFAEVAHSPPPPAPVHIALSIPPILNFSSMDNPSDVASSCLSHVQALFPSLANLADAPSPASSARSIFLSERSVSLWSQLVAPPPLQPPNWVRSRTRRLFLVSLGVPVDLDEILPASKQKKLVLPSVSFSTERSPRPSSDDRGGGLGAVQRLKSQGANTSNTSLDSASLSASGARGGSPSKKTTSSRKKKGPIAPRLDVQATVMLCSTTEEALSGFTDEELRRHVNRLAELKGQAEEAFGFWQGRKESALGDKQAFEGVIENLVKHAKKVRK